MTFLRFVAWAFRSGGFRSWGPLAYLAVVALVGVAYTAWWLVNP